MKILGLIIGGAALVFAVLLLSAWVAMLVFGAYIATSHAEIVAPGFWQTFFGLWSLSILGGAIHSGSYVGGWRKDK